MEKIFSEIEKTLLLHLVYRCGDLESQLSSRLNFGDEKDYLQVAAIRSPANTSYASHIHLERERKFKNLKAQESWVVIRGAVQVEYFDIDETFITSKTLNQGDVTITFHGGHGYKILDSETLVYEYKSGPYEGVEVDKRFIN